MPNALWGAYFNAKSVFLSRENALITEIRVRNFRGLTDAAVALGRWTILYGTNGAGKSSLLDSLNLLSSFATGTTITNAFPGGVFSLQSQLHDPTVNTMEFVARHRVGDPSIGAVETLEYSVVFEAGQRLGKVGAERLMVDGATVMDVSGGIASRLQTSDCRDPMAASEVVQAHQFVRRYRLEPRALRAASSAHHFIEKNGVGLPSSLSYLEAGCPEAFDRLRTDFLALFPEIADLRVARLGGGDLALEFDTGAAQGLSGVHLSDGQALTLGILFLAHSPNAPRVLLLDEPEVTLSPVLVKRLLDRTESALSSDRQVLLTTHSPYVLQWGIHNDAEVRQVRGDFGTRSWRDALHQQGIEHSTMHTDATPITIGHCCALLETYLTA